MYGLMPMLTFSLQVCKVELMMCVLIKVLLVGLVLGFFTTSINGDCVLPLPRFRFFAPLIFSTDGTLLETDNYNEHALTITVPANKDLILSCAPNYFKKASLNTLKFLTAQCKNGNEFEINGSSGELNWITDLSCEVRPVEETKKSIVGCPSNATSVEFGYENPIKSNTQVIGEACYSESEGRTIFVHTKLAEAGEASAAVLKTERVNYLSRNHPDSKYKIDFLVAANLDELNLRLQKLLSKKKVPFFEPRHFIDLPMFQNGQLNSALKLGWNFVVTNGFDHLPNYDLLLSDIMSLNEDAIDIYMGTHSVLSLKSGDHNADVYLLPDELKYPVPEYLWVAVKTSTGQSAGFLISNDIGASENYLAENAPVENRCSQLHWLTNLLRHDAYKTSKNGYVICNQLSFFIETIPEMSFLGGRVKSATFESATSFNNDVEMI